MGKLSDIRARSRIGDLIEGQPQHLGLAFLLTCGAVALIGPESSQHRLLGLTSAGWACLSIALALLHQMIVALVFRLQLHRNLMSRLFGEHDMAVWRVIFMPLLVSRPLTVLMAGLADTAPVTGYRGIEVVTGTVLICAALWAMHSVLVHFTLPRALGGDHFRDSYAEMPLVREGAFKYTSNAMYGVVFLGLWGIALVCGSWTALVLALFQHCYIWVHMYCTESPDMAWIYGNR